jgi:glycosyltransferase involved in cell wall biosynthesis
MDKVSVIIPTFNRQDTLLRAVQSALQQTYPVHEVLVCDDGSDDGSEKLISDLNDMRVKWVACGKNGRPAVPRNKGIDQSSGDWIAFLDSDDEWLPGKIEAQLKLASKGYEAVCSNANRIQGGENKGLYSSYAKSIISFTDLLYSNPVICSSVLIRKNVLQSLSVFPEEPEFRAIEDYELWLRIATRFSFLYTPEPLLNYTDSPSTSIRGNESDVWKQKKIIFSGLKIWMQEHHIKLDPDSKKALSLARKHANGKGKLPIPTRIGLKAGTLLKNVLNKKEYKDPSLNQSTPKFEMDDQIISDFVINKLVPIAGSDPFPLDELMLITATVCRFKPRMIFEWDTGIGKSARIFYEIIHAFSIPAEIHSIDTKPRRKNSGKLVQNLTVVNLYQADGLKKSLDLIEQKKPGGKILFFIDSEQDREQLKEELTIILEKIPDAVVLLHDTFYQPEHTQSGKAPYLALNDVLTTKNTSYRSLSTDKGLPGLSLVYQEH